MVECRHCRAFFETPPEEIGARCPDCKMPLFERPERPRREIESGTCVHHPTVPGTSNCSRCQARLCATCRTRWHEDNLCLACVEASLAAGERHPREVKARRMMAIRGFVLALAGALLFLLGIWILYSSRVDPTGGGVAWSLVLIILGIFPCAIGLGQGMAVVLVRGPLLRLATAAVAVAASQIGLTVGLTLINFWRN